VIYVITTILVSHSAKKYMRCPVPIIFFVSEVHFVSTGRKYSKENMACFSMEFSSTEVSKALETPPLASYVPVRRNDEQSLLLSQ
jgi:hypothetical protein